MTLRCERIRREIDQAPCDHCGRLIEVDGMAAVHLETGMIFCDRACALAYSAAELTELLIAGWDEVED